MGLLDKITGKEDALQKLVDLKMQAAKARVAFDQECWLNLAFFHGEQWTEWHNGGIREIPRLFDPARDIDERDLPRPVFNKIQSYIYTAQADTLQDKPSFDVLTATNDYQAQMDQFVCKGFLDWVMDPSNIDWDKQLSQATLWALIAPAGYLKWIYDETLGRPDAVVVPYPDLFVDPFANQFKRARYAIHSQFMDVAEAEDMWDVKIDSGDVGYVDEFKVDLLRNMGTMVQAQGVTVNELWMRPTRKYPKGVYAVYTGRKILKIQDRLPYDHLLIDGGRLPFSQLGSLERADSLYYTTPVTALRPAQMVWNKFLAQALQVYDAFANPKWWIPEELQMHNMPNSSPRQVLRGTGPTGVKPEILQGANAPDVSGLLGLFEQQMMHVVSVHEVSQGQVPGRVEAAKAIELLQSQDKGRYKHLHDTIDSALSQGGWQMLMLAKQFMPDGKLVPITSREGAHFVKQWKKGAMDPATRVRTVRMSGLGRTRAQRTDTLNTMWQNQVITDPATMAELMDLPRNSFTNPNAQDILLAQAENYELASGIAVNPNSWDDHKEHLHQHNEYRKTAEYRALGQDAKGKFEKHCTDHEKLWLIELQKQATRAAVASGQAGALSMQAGGAAPGGVPQPTGSGPSPQPQQAPASAGTAGANAPQPGA